MSYDLKLPGPISLLKESWNIFKAKFKPLLQISFIVFVVTALAEIFFPAKIVDDVYVFTFPNFIANLSVTIIAMLCSIAMVYVINDSLRARESLEKAPKIFWPYFFTSIMAMIIMAVGFVLLIVPGVIFTAWYAFVGLVVIIDNIRGWSALKKSKEYVKGHTGEVIVRWVSIIFLVIILLIPSFILYGYGTLVSNLYMAVVFLFITPLIEIYIYRMFIHLKEIKNSGSVVVQE